MQPLSFLEYCNAYQYESQLYLRTRQDFIDVRDFRVSYEHYIRESGFPQTLKMTSDRQHIIYVIQFI